MFVECIIFIEEMMSFYGLLILHGKLIHVKCLSISLKPEEAAKVNCNNTLEFLWRLIMRK